MELKEVWEQNLSVVEEVRKMFEPVSNVRKYLSCTEGQSFRTPQIVVYWEPDVRSYDNYFPDKEILGKASPYILIQVSGISLYLTRNGGWINTGKFSHEVRKATEEEVLEVLDSAQIVLAQYVATLAMPKVLSLFNEKKIGFKELKVVQKTLEDVGVL